MFGIDPLIVLDIAFHRHVVPRWYGQRIEVILVAGRTANHGSVVQTVSQLGDGFDRHPVGAEQHLQHLQERDFAFADNDEINTGLVADDVLGEACRMRPREHRRGAVRLGGLGIGDRLSVIEARRVEPDNVVVAKAFNL